MNVYVETGEMSRASETTRGWRKKRSKRAGEEEEVGQNGRESKSRGKSGRRKVWKNERVREGGSEEGSQGQKYLE